MARQGKWLLHLTVAAFGLGTTGCSGARSILRGQSPEAAEETAALEWWRDPRLRRVQSRWNDPGSEPSRFWRIAGTAAQVPLGIAALFLGSALDPSLVPDGRGVSASRAGGVSSGRAPDERTTRGEKARPDRNREHPPT
jgi:hypothetical protein